MRLFIVALAVLFILLSYAGMIMFVFPSVTVADQISFSKEKFTAKVENVRLQSVLVKQGKRSEDIVTVQVNAHMFSPKILIEDVRQETESYGAEVDFLVEYTKVNIEGNVEKILGFWAPDERNHIRKILSDPEIVSRNIDYLERNPGLRIVGIVDQGSTKSILQERSSIVLGVNILRYDGHLYLTNKTANDMELAIIEASFVR